MPPPGRTAFLMDENFFGAGSGVLPAALLRAPGLPVPSGRFHLGRGGLTVLLYTTKK